MNNNRITLSQARKFHGHLGPYLVLGILSGELAIKKLRCKKYFDLYVKAWGVDKKPKSCLIDGLQLSTGATYGKGNIEKLGGSTIKIEFHNRLNLVRNNKAPRKENKISNGVNHRKIILRFQRYLIQKLKKAKTHRDSESLAKQLYRINRYNKLFRLQ